LCVIPTWIVVHEHIPDEEVKDKETLRTDIDPALESEVVVSTDVVGKYALDRATASYPAKQ